MKELQTMAGKIRERLAQVTEALAALLAEIPIHRVEREGGGVVFIMPEFWWDDPCPELRNRQIALKKEYDHVVELLRASFAGAPRDVLKSIDTADDAFRKWLQLEQNWGLTKDSGKNEESFRKDAAEIRRIVDILDSGPKSDPIVVPDTNSLIATADPTNYRLPWFSGGFTFLLLPTVLHELDKLKIEHRNEAVRTKAEKAIAMIKGWRKQGQLLSGVTVDKNITVQTVAVEPDMKATLSWLDSDNPDDRIVTSVLQVQAQNPTSAVVLATGDINLQNKAEFAMIEYDEIPSARGGRP